MSNQSVNSLNIPSIQNQNQINFQQNPTSMQGAVDREKIKQSVDNSYLANRAKASEESNPAATLGLGTAIWYGLSQGMDRFNRACEGSYEKSLLGKIGHWGDKGSTNTYLGRKFEGSIRWLDKKILELAGKSKIVNVLRNFSTRPEWSFAKTPGAGVHGFLATDTESIFKEFLEPITGCQTKGMLGIPLGPKYNYYQALEQYGKMSQAEINQFVQSLNGKTFEQKALALQKKELELLGADAGIVSKIEGKTGIKGLEKFAKSLKVKKLGFKSLREYNELAGKYLDNPDKIIKVLNNADPNIKISIWRKHGTWGKIKNNLFGRTISLTEYRNKYFATLGKGNHTSLGRFLPKSIAWISEGCTNRFCGGKLGVAMQAGIFADMLYHTIKAPKGEKGKTLAERFVNDFTYFIALTFGIMAMHKVGGFKYIGLVKKLPHKMAGLKYDGLKNQKALDAYRKGLAEFNDKVRAGKLGNKKAYKFAERRLDVLLGKKNIKNPIHKLLYKIGKFINMGNERKLAYRSASNVNINWLRKLANGNILGVPMRIIIPLMVISPFLAKLTTKTAHKIFGRPTNSVLDEDKEPEETAPQNQSPVQEPNKIPEIKPAQETQTPVRKNPNEYASDTNLIKMHANGKTPESVNNPHETSPETSAPKESATEENKAGEKEPQRTYIPSPVGMVPQGPDMSEYNQAIAKVDAAEQYANSVLKMT